MPDSWAKALAPTTALFGEGRNVISWPENLARGIKLIEFYVCRHAEALAAHVERRGNLFQRRVAGPFADAVDGALHLARAGLHRRQRIGHSQSQIVVAVRGKHHALLVDGGNALAHFAEHLPVLFRRGVAHRVGHIDGGGAGFDGDAHHLHQKIAVRAGRILGRKLHVIAKRTRQTHRLAAQFQRLGAAHLQLVLEVQIARRQKNMDACTIGKLQRPRRHFNVFFFCPSQ